MTTIEFDWKERYTSEIEGIIATIVTFGCTIISLTLLCYCGVHKILIEKILQSAPKMLQRAVFGCVFCITLYITATTINYTIWTFFPTIAPKLTCFISMYDTVLVYGSSRLSLYLFFLCRFYFCFNTTLFAMKEKRVYCILFSMIFTTTAGFGLLGIGAVRDNCSDETWFRSGLLAITQDSM